MISYEFNCKNVPLLEDFYRLNVIIKNVHCYPLSSQLCAGPPRMRSSESWVCRLICIVRIALFLAWTLPRFPSFGKRRRRRAAPLRALALLSTLVSLLISQFR